MPLSPVGRRFLVFTERSRADFANKIGNVQKEAAETQYWIELLIEAGIGNAQNTTALHKESTELLAIFTTIGKRLKE